MKHVKCECGHVNPHGTILCEACGKPIAEETTDKLVDMVMKKRKAIANVE